MFAVGVNSRHSDGVCVSSQTSAAVENKRLQIHSSKEPARLHTALAHVVVGDEGFPVNAYLMKLYPHRGFSTEEMVFNDRLSRARWVSENVFVNVLNNLPLMQYRCT